MNLLVHTSAGMCIGTEIVSKEMSIFASMFASRLMLIINLSHLASCVMTLGDTHEAMCTRPIETYPTAFFEPPKHVAVTNPRVRQRCRFSSASDAPIHATATKQSQPYLAAGLLPFSCLELRAAASLPLASSS